jgi:hypothetical protein
LSKDFFNRLALLELFLDEFIHELLRLLVWGRNAEGFH